MAERSRLTIDMTPALHRQLKMRAALAGKSMRQICIEAIQRQLHDDAAPTALTRASAPALVDLWDNEADAIYDDEEI